MENSKWDVIIIGAGPVGLSLANLLVMGGVRVLILEKNSSLSRHSKAITIWPPVQEIFAALGLLGTFEEKALCFEKLTLHDADEGGGLVSFPFYELENETQFPRLLMLPQNQTESILLSGLKKRKSTLIKFNARALDFEQLDDEIKVGYLEGNQRHTSVSKVVVGCDGADSFVREYLQIDFTGKTFAQKAALADVRLKQDPKYASPRLSARKKLYAGFHIGNGLWRIIMLRKENDNSTLEDEIETAAAHLFNTEKMDIVWKSVFHLHSRVAGDFVKGNIILAGDAAHLNSPLGGEGMNAGIIDVWNLLPALLKKLETGSMEELFRYAEKRKTNLKKGVNKNTGILTKILFIKQGKYAKSFLTILNMILWFPFFRKKFLKKMTILD